MCPKGTILKNPSETELARALGMVRITSRIDLRRRGRRRGTRWPLDRGLRRIGGSLGDCLRRTRFRWTSWGKRSYRELSRLPIRHFRPGTHWPRLYPAQKFGATMMIPIEVVHLDLTETPVTLRLRDGRRVNSPTVVVATGARYRRLNVPNLPDFEGRGNWYSASPSRRACVEMRRSFWWQRLGGPSRRFSPQLRFENPDAGPWTKSHREHVAVSHRPHRGDREYRSIDQTEIVPVRGSGKATGARALANNVTGDKRRSRSATYSFSSARIRRRACSRTAGSLFRREEFRLNGFGYSPPTFARQAIFPPPAAAGNERSSCVWIGDVRSGSVKRVARQSAREQSLWRNHALLANDGPLRRDSAGISDRTATAKAHLSDSTRIRAADAPPFPCHPAQVFIERDAQIGNDGSSFRADFLGCLAAVLIANEPKHGAECQESRLQAPAPAARPCLKDR